MRYAEQRKIVMDNIKEETKDYQLKKDSIVHDYNYGYVKGMLSLAYILGYISQREYNDYDEYLTTL